MDFKYIFIRLAQKLIIFTNYIEVKTIDDNKITLKGNEKLLIIKGDRIGDGVWGVHFVKILKSNFPDLQVDIICNKYNKFVFEESHEIYDNLFVLDEKPPEDFLKNFYKIGKGLFDNIRIFTKNKEFWKQLKSNKYDYIINLTGRKYFLASKYLGKTVGGRLGLFNWLYDYPILKHPEIGNNTHVINQWLGKFTNIDKKLGIVSNQISGGKKVILFIGGKQPGKLSCEFYKNLLDGLKKNNIETVTLDDEPNEKGNYLLEKNGNGFYVNNVSLKEFLKNYSLFIGIDGGVIHYVSNYIPTLSFYICTNYKIAHPFCGQLFENQYIDEVRFYKTKLGKNFLISSEFKCLGCFKIGCKLQRCKQSLDKKWEIVIKEIKSILKAPLEETKETLKNLKNN
ncbi:MAG: hypothetical protein V3575_05995 [Candidatus Absconditabacteria bacterium]